MGVRNKGTARQQYSFIDKLCLCSVHIFSNRFVQLFSHLQLECMDSLRGQLDKANARLDDLQAQV